MVTRFDDAQEILARSEDFVVPYGRKGLAIGWEPTFLLGKECRDDEYEEMLSHVNVLWRADEEAVASIARQVAVTALDGGVDHADAMQAIVVESALQVVERYYGIPIEEKEKWPLVQAAYAVAGYLFGAPHPGAKSIKAARESAEVIWKIIDLAKPQDAPPNTVLGRAHLMLEDKSTKLTPEKLRSYLMGMITGFLPAHTNAAGRALIFILNREDARRAAVEAAGSGDATRVLTVVYEALRFSYILPGLWRTNHEPQTMGWGTKHLRSIAPETQIYVSTWSAMQDHRRVRQPRRFCTDRSPHVYMPYGYKFHYCVGRGIADRLLHENLAAIFLRQARPNGKTQWEQLIPNHIPIRYKPLDQGDEHGA